MCSPSVGTGPGRWTSPSMSIGLATARNGSSPSRGVMSTNAPEATTCGSSSTERAVLIGAHQTSCSSNLATHSAIGRRGEGDVELGDQLGAVADALPGAREPLVGEQVLALDRRGQAGPVAIGLQPEQPEPGAVGGGVAVDERRLRRLPVPGALQLAEAHQHAEVPAGAVHAGPQQARRHEVAPARRAPGRTAPRRCRRPASSR